MRILWPSAFSFGSNLSTRTSLPDDWTNKLKSLSASSEPVALASSSIFSSAPATKTVMTRAHSFPWKILPNPTDQFAKFCKIPWLTAVNYLNYRGLPFVRKLSFILLKNFSFQLLAWHSVMLATYKKLSIFFLSKSAICQLVALWLFTIVPYMMVILNRDAVLGSSVWFFSISKPMIVLIISHFLTSATFRGKIKIPQKRANSVAWLEILQPAENCGRLW